MRISKLFFCTVFCILFTYASIEAEEGSGENKILIMKPRLVEGELEKPAIIIVPRAKLLKEGLFRKSFYNDIVRDLYLTPFKDETLYEKKTFRSDREK